MILIMTGKLIDTNVLTNFCKIKDSYLIFTHNRTKIVVVVKGKGVEI